MGRDNEPPGSLRCETVASDIPCSKLHRCTSGASKTFMPMHKVHEIGLSIEFHEICTSELIYVVLVILRSLLTSCTKVGRLKIYSS